MKKVRTRKQRRSRNTKLRKTKSRLRTQKRYGKRSNLLKRTKSKSYKSKRIFSSKKRKQMGGMFNLFGDTDQAAPASREEDTAAEERHGMAITGIQEEYRRLLNEKDEEITKLNQENREYLNDLSKLRTIREKEKADYLVLKKENDENVKIIEGKSQETEGLRRQLVEAQQLAQTSPRVRENQTEFKCGVSHVGKWDTKSLHPFTVKFENRQITIIGEESPFTTPLNCSNLQLLGVKGKSRKISDSSAVGLPSQRGFIAKLKFIDDNKKETNVHFAFDYEEDRQQFLITALNNMVGMNNRYISDVSPDSSPVTRLTAIRAGGHDGR